MNKITRAVFTDLVDKANVIMVGKSHQIRLALTCFFAGGHLLIEDMPGVGKTTLARVLAKILGLQFQRIQFTSDLLPADIIGASIFDRQQSSFDFKPGPIFSELVLADEINRATPKTQSALLEAMEERQVTTEGVTRHLPELFFVVATQNPSHQIGTFALPESQLDRFLMRITLDYPDSVAERELLQGVDRRELLSEVSSSISHEILMGIRQSIKTIRVSSAILDYCQALLSASRLSEEFENGLSPRAGIVLVRCAQAWAFADDRDYVVPEDIQAIFNAVVDHRLIARANHMMKGYSAGQTLLNRVAV